MKRKVYVKQMKLLKEKSKKTEAKQDASKETDDPSNFSPQTQESSKVLEAVLSPSPSRSTRSAVSITRWGSTPSTTVSNSDPLPKVDVLMKNSSLRAFQLRQTQNYGSENLVQSSSQSLSEDENNIQILHPEAPPLIYMGSRVNQENVKMDSWAKSSSVIENSSNMSPIPAHSHYRVDYSGPYNVNLEQVDNPADDNNAQPSSPVFHQLQASRISDNNVQHDMNSFADHKIPDEHRHAHDIKPYNLHVAGPREIHQNQVSELIRYNQDPTTHLNEHEPVQSWEQENYRYVDLSWRDDERAESRESAYSSSIEDEDDIDHNMNVLDGSIDLSNKNTRSSSKIGGRRRRKRVQTPVQRSAANMRERRRMSHLNVAFEYLKEHLPNVKDKRKLSRIQTLKAAIYYIHLLQDSLNVN